MMNFKTTRFNDIKEKFEYAEKLRQELMSLMFKAKKDEVEINPIMHYARTILSECRECYDYCFNDIFEKFILPLTTNRRILSDFKNNKLKLYFPFFEKQFRNTTLTELLILKSSLYDHLFELSKKMKNNESIPKTLYRYGSILELRDMVNTKKHDKLLAVISDPQQEMLVESDIYDAIFPIKKNIDMHKLCVAVNSKVKLVDEFLFEFNNIEVYHFCTTSLFVTRIIIDEIYKKYFGMKFIHSN